MKKMVQKIAICSRHAILAAGFRALVAGPMGVQIVECGETPELLQLLRLPASTSSPSSPQSQAGVTAGVTDGGSGANGRHSGELPNLLLVDLDSIGNLHGVGELKSLAPQAGLILWVDWISPEFVRDAIHTGVRGILRKDASVELSVQCLQQVAAGKMWLDSEMSEKLLRARPVRLSPRERQLVGLLTEGLRNKEIAGRMQITEGTAKAYLSRLFEKTGASDRFELAMFALRNLETNPSAGPSRGPRIFHPLRAAFSRRA